MKLLWVAVSSLLLVGTGYAVARRVEYSPIVAWALLCTSLFVLSTRDLLRSREHGRPVTDAKTASDERGDARSDPRPSGRGDRRTSVRTWLLSRLAGLLT